MRLTSLNGYALGMMAVASIKKNSSNNRCDDSRPSHFLRYYHTTAGEYQTLSKWKFMHTLPTPKGANRKSKIPIGKRLQLRTKVVLGVVSYPTGMSHPSSPKNEFSGSKPIAHQRFPAKRSKTLARQRAREADVKFSAALLRQRSQSFTTFTVGERKRVPPFVVGLAGSCKHETE